MFHTSSMTSACSKVQWCITIILECAIIKGKKNSGYNTKHMYIHVYIQYAEVEGNNYCYLQIHHVLFRNDMHFHAATFFLNSMD